MMTPTLPETESQIKVLCSERLQLPPADLTNNDIGLHRSGSIVFRFNVCGIVEVEIVTDQSDDEDTLRQRLTAARPMLEVLRRLFFVDPLTRQRIR